MIIANNLVKKYESNDGEEIRALDELTLFLPDKGFIAIYGASGCGKSTLLNVLGGLDQADSGTLIVNGRNTNKFTRADWDSYRNQQVGFIFQNYYLLPHLTVHDNIAITLQMSKQTQDLDKKVKDALNQVEMGKYSRRYPRQLSGGQQQRVAIARALISNPAIILADEPTGALDEKSSKIVMENLQKISKEHLVVMVTHNERMAKKYADRMIEISYGKIISDDIIQPETDDIANNEPLLKVHLPLHTAIGWSAKNVVRKKGRSIPIAIASAIGLGCAGIVLSMSRGVDEFVYDAQKDAISNYPVQVRCVKKNTSAAKETELTKFPEEQAIIIDKPTEIIEQHYYTMQEDFISYMNKMPDDYYTHVHSNSKIKFNMLTKTPFNTVIDINTINSYNFVQCIAPINDDYRFINDQYEVVSGHLPTSEEDLVLVIDKYNRVNVDVLNALGIDTSADKINFSDIVGKKEYHVVQNNDFYSEETKTIQIPVENPEAEEIEGETPEEPETIDKTYTYYKKVNDYPTLYDNPNNLTLKITGIIRPKTDSKENVYETCLLYHDSFRQKIRELNESSDIVVKQKEYGEDFNVYTGSLITEHNGKQKSYFYEEALRNIGAEEIITSYYYFTDTTEQRAQIINYVDNYNLPRNSEIVIRTSDYLEAVTSAFTSLANTFESVVFILSLVAILIAAILTAILTYISVVERKNEIGLLRSLGARKRDISFMFITESVLIGIVAGAVGVGICYAFSPVVAKIVVNMISMAGSNILVPKISTFSRVPLWLIPIMFFGAIVVGLISSLVPAIIAGRKKPADAIKG